MTSIGFRTGLSEDPRKGLPEDVFVQQALNLGMYYPRNGLSEDSGPKIEIRKAQSEDFPKQRSNTEERQAG